MNISPTFVYVARIGDYVKIGHSKDVRRRMRQLSAQHPGMTYPPDYAPQEAVLLATFESSDAVELERALQDAFASERVLGEWFRWGVRFAVWAGQRRQQSWLDTDLDLDTGYPPGVQPPVVVF